MRPLFLILALALLLPVPLGGAEDHVYSHRFILEGRLVGSDGAPLPDRLVEFFSRGGEFNEPCLDEGHHNVTDPTGDFRFCFHVHALDVRATVGVRSGNASVERQMDTGFRKTVVILREPNETGVPSEEWNATHLVAGRVWRSGAAQLDGVQVYGVAVPHAPVNVTLRGPNETESRFELTTDQYGDFSTRIRLGDHPDPANLTVHVESLGQERTQALDPFSHRITVGIILMPETDDAFRTFLPDAGRPAAPGTTTPRVQPLFVIALAAAIGLTLYGTSRKAR